MKKIAIILAAGLGSRLLPLTKEEHKCMTQVCGVPIIQNTLKNLEDNDFSKVIIVVGYLGDKLMDEIRNMKLKIKIEFVLNPCYAQSNTTYSLKYGLDYINEVYDFLCIIEGDVIFEKKIIERLFKSEHENVSVLEPYNVYLDGTFVEIGDNNNIVDWRHKSDQEDNYTQEGKYKTVNIHKFSYEFVQTYLINSIEDNIKQNGFKQPIEKVMKQLVNNYPDLIFGEVLNGEKWYEIDDLNDLANAEKIWEE